MILYDIVDPVHLLGYTRSLVLEEERNRFLLSEFLPNVDVTEITFEVDRTTLTQADEMVIRSWDTESEIGRRQGVAKARASLAPMSKKMRLGEEERLRAIGLGRSGADTHTAINKIYDDAGNMARGGAARIERLRAAALFGAGLAINENGVIQTVSYGRNGSLTVTASVLWTLANAATSKPITDLQTWQQVYIDINGITPALFLTSSAAVAGMLASAEVKAMLSMPAGTPQLVTVAAMQSVLQALGLPPVGIYDAVSRVSGTNTRLTPANKGIFLPPASEALGSTFMGPTADAIEMVETGVVDGELAPGFSVVVTKETDPVAVWTKVGAVSFPYIPNPDLTMTATVQ